MAADAFRANSAFKTDQAILELGTGEALISFLDEKGAPEIVEKATVLPPQSKMGAIDDMTRNKVINMSALIGKYDEAEDPESASEIISQRAETKAAEAQAEKEALLAEKARKEAEKAEEKAEKERLKLAEKEKVAAERERIRREKEAAQATKAKSSKKSTADRFLGNVLGSAGSAIGRNITNKILKDLFKKEKDIDVLEKTVGNFICFGRSAVHKRHGTTPGNRPYRQGSRAALPRLIKCL